MRLHPSAPHWVVSPASGCWIWLGALDKDLYGVGYHAGRKRPAHIAVWLRAGKPEPGRGMVLDHTCELRCCVNPDHLKLVTPAENVQRTSRTKLTAAQVVELRKMWVTGATYKEIAQHFDVCRGTVWYVIGKGWKNIKHEG